jgi:CRISPR-associated protein Cas2
MLVMTLKNTPKSLKGALSRWLIEIHPGVFLGNPSARVRDELWNKAICRCKQGSVLQVWSAPNAQGYEYRQINPGSRELKDFDGLALVFFKSKKVNQKRR